MLLKYFYDPKLAHASYMVGCQKTNEAIIVDPGRDVQQYLDAAEEEDMTIVGVADTHIHADYVSGARELADRVDAKLFVSDEGDASWKYEYADQYRAQLLKDGDHFYVGKVRLDVMHTPGHTPESISFILTDEGGGATKPMGIFTGDFVFVGSIGRPDLLEKAAGATGTARAGAVEMFDSVNRFKALPDYLQVWPAHGAGSACGKGLGAIPSSTVGYEKLFNPALQYDEEEAFIDYLLDSQPEVPYYFKEMKRVNKEGPEVLYGKTMPAKQSPESVTARVEAGEQVIDTRPYAAFGEGYVPGTINIPMDYLAQWAGWLVDWTKPVYLITHEETLEEAVRVLNKIGYDLIEGYFNPDEVADAGLNSGSYDVMSIEDASEAILNDEVTLVDVRAESEWEEGHLPNAEHLFLGTLPKTAESVIDGKLIVVQCRTGGRSAIGASILKAAGADRVINLAGGYRDWAAAGLPTEQ